MEGPIAAPTCKYCKKTFYSHGNLLNHTKTAKYCLKIQGVTFNTPHTCEFCDAQFTQKAALQTHLKSCEHAKNVENSTKINTLEEKVKILESKLVKLSKENRNLQSKNIQLSIKLKNIEAQKDAQNNRLATKVAEKNTKIAEQNDEIISLQKCVSEKEGLTKGILIGIDKAKPQVVHNIGGITNNIVKQKLAAIPIGNIEPFTIDLVNRNIDKYDYKTFMQGSLGIVNYIKGITILEMTDGTIEKNYACTNRSRNTFHRLVEDKNWKQDGGARFIQEIFSTLSSTASEHMDTLAGEIKALPVRSDRKRWLIEEEAKLRDIETGLKKKDSKEREELFMQVKNQIKETNNC